MKQQEQEAHCPFCEPESLAEWGWLDQPLKNADWGGIFWVTPLNPVTEGHTLIVPGNHFMYADQHPMHFGEVAMHAARYAKSKGLKAYNLIQSNGADATQTVGHVHLHVVPRTKGDGLHLPWTGQEEAGG